jgi:transcriptional regulator with GAF, ATPase, and Fis domain
MDMHLLSAPGKRQPAVAAITPTDTDEQLDGVIGTAPCMRDVFDRVRRVAPTDATVLVTARPGLAKSYWLAPSIGDRGARRNRW